MPAQKLHLVDKPTWVYQLRCRHGGVLYVGIARDLERRMADHRSTKTWWPEVGDVIAHQFPNRPLARRMELALILYRQPLHNVEGVNEYDQYHADPLSGWSLGLPFTRLEFGGGN